MENAYSEPTGIFDFGPFGLNVQYSLDNGETWELLGGTNDGAGTNWYNVSESSPLVFPELENVGWIEQTIEVEDGDTTFIPKEVKYNVSFLTGFDQVNFRIVFYAAAGFSDIGYEADGVLVDDFQIKKSSPTAEFKLKGTGIAFVGNEVEFDYISSGASSFEWDFGDGNTSTLENPTHIYTERGSYDVSLTITSPDGNSTVAKENFITVIPTGEIPYSIVDGGDLEGEVLDFVIENVSGTGFQIGQSVVEGKAGTASGENAIVTGLNENQYQNNSEAYIYTPQFEFESIGNYEFAFETNYSFEDNWDGFIVEYTLDQGETWLKLNDEQADDWYNQISDPQSVFGNQVPIFSGNTANNFVRKSTDISFLGGEGTISFRIKFLTDAAEIDVGMAIDNIEILGPVPGPAIPDFSVDFQSGCEGTTVVFSNESSGSIKSLEWNFGEGAEPETATGVGPHEVIYNNSGGYSVSLTAEDVNDVLVTEEKNDFIIIGSDHIPTFTVSEPDEDGLVLLTASEGDSYQWFYRDAIIEGAREKTLLTESSGNYKVAVTIDGCQGISENSIVTSNDSPLAKSLSIFPNPLNNERELNISFTNGYLGEYHVEVYSLKGQQILTEKFNKVDQKEEQIINFNEAKEGLYLIRISTGNESTQMKVLIE